MRKKIWGTDQPPGAKDPYKQDSMSQYQKTKEPAKKPAASAAPADMSTYQPADNAEGLEEVGGKGIWWMNRVEPEFEGFIPSMKLEDPYEVTAALHRAVVEVFALRAAELPLSTLGAAGITPDMTSEVQIVAAQDGARLGLPDHIKLEELTATLRPARDEVSVKTNPSPAEAEVAADRTEVDPIMATKVKGAVDETITKGNPSPAEAEVAADRSGNDPLKDATFMQMVEHWDPVWLSVSLKEPEVKFAVSHRSTISLDCTCTDSATAC